MDDFGEDNTQIMIWQQHQIISLIQEENDTPNTLIYQIIYNDNPTLNGLFKCEIENPNCVLLIPGPINLIYIYFKLNPIATESNIFGKFAQLQSNWNLDFESYIIPTYWI